MLEQRHPFGATIRTWTIRTKVIRPKAVRTVPSGAVSFELLF